MLSPSPSQADCAVSVMHGCEEVKEEGGEQCAEWQARRSAAEGEGVRMTEREDARSWLCRLCRRLIFIKIDHARYCYFHPSKGGSK